MAVMNKKLEARKEGKEHDALEFYIGIEFPLREEEKYMVTLLEHISSSFKVVSPKDDFESIEKRVRNIEKNDMMKMH